MAKETYRKAHQIMNVVRKEFEFQGHVLHGPAAALAKAGAVGKHQNNIRRDWFRRMGVPLHWVDVPLWEFGEEGWDEVSTQLCNKCTF
ncbi:unnamed protein product [Durusdinium trenchii]|uniref:Uncharacterized protein n=1 Tax=Durusdinium trenchii TaxID=1381693 RepID=A0ABP0L8E5_9DINO